MFNDDENEEGEFPMPEALQNILRRAKKYAEIEKQAGEIGDASREQGEKEILMGLWAELGEGTYSYSESFRGIAAFNKATDKARKAVKNIDPDVSIKILKAVAAQLNRDADTFQVISDKFNEVMDDED